MTAIVEKKWNPATKRSKVVRYIAFVHYARPHGRPRNVGKRLKIRKVG